jgi:uncharacterized membrane protein
MFKNFIFIYFIVLALVHNIFAAQVKQTFDIKSNVNSYFNFDQFDESLGNLRSIAILFCLQITDGQLILDNDGTSRATGDLQFGARGSISSTDVVLL